MNGSAYPNHERSLAEVVAEIKDEVKTFLVTRMELFTSELKESTKTLKTAVPLAIGALVLMGTAYLLLTLALVGLVAVAFWGNPYAWFFAFLIVGVVWVIGGGMLAFFAYNDFKARGTFPKKTMEVLKADKMWLESEVRSKAA